jgi:mutator protein MutT
VIHVAAAIIEQHGRLLICQRRKTAVQALKWEFPGGKVRRSETPRAALVRELREELGATASVGGAFWHTRHRYSIFAQPLHITFFRVGSLSAPPRNLAFERMAWVRPADLPRYDFLAADRAVVNELMGGMRWNGLRR